MKAFKKSSHFFSYYFFLGKLTKLALHEKKILYKRKTCHLKNIYIFITL